MSKVRVRYAPSPSGIPHIGNIRTALFNFLFAKNQKGDFILRIEDTDQKRLVPEAIPKIKESLTLLSLIWDEIYQQSKRISIYDRHLAVLKEKSVVYEDEGSWRFRVEKGKNLEWQDLVHGPVKFSSDVIEDFIVIKSDTYPTYHFASVVDDHDMQISHVIRGDEWISSTPKHLLLYQAFNWQPPEFVHLPPILGPNKKKLSKREGAKSVMEFQKEGYLPEALINFMALLGWSPSPSEALSEGGKKEKELFSLNELIAIFSLDQINKNSPIFNLEKLKWFNGQWIRKLKQEEYVKRISKFYPSYDSLVTQSVAPLTQERVSILTDYQKIADFFYHQPTNIPSVSVSAATISKLTTNLKAGQSWNSASIKAIIDNTAKVQNVDRVELIAAIRNIISGSTVTPPLYESLEKLGKDETVKRLNSYAKKTKK